jgi:hypothetical protein
MAPQQDCLVNNIGAANLSTGRTVFRYSGQVCLRTMTNCL